MQGNVTASATRSLFTSLLKRTRMSRGDMWGRQGARIWKIYRKKIHQMYRILYSCIYRRGELFFLKIQWTTTTTTKWLNPYLIFLN